ncbi:hypothetical protein ACFQU2_00870 [Siccirubricoccus deserti]
MPGRRDITALALGACWLVAGWLAQPATALVLRQPGHGAGGRQRQGVRHGAGA